MADFIIRRGVEADTANIRKLMIDLIAYHDMPDIDRTVKEMDVDSNALIYKTFVAEVITDTGKTLVGYTLYYHQYSVFMGHTFYMQDLMVAEQFRRSGIGEALVKAVVKVTLESGCTILNFHGGDWNITAKNFYLKIGSIILSPEESYSEFKFNNSDMIAVAANLERNATTLVNGEVQGVNKIDDVVVRKGEREDGPEILRNILERAKQSKKRHEVEITVEDLESNAFGTNKLYRSVVVEVESNGRKQIVGYGLYVIGCNYSGRIILMDDLYISENFSSSALEMTLLKTLIQDGMDNGCKELFVTLDTLEDQRTAFYTKLGAYNWSEKYGMNFYILEEDTMKKLSA